MSGGIVHLFCPVHAVPIGERVEQIPGPAKTRTEVSKGRGGVQLVQREIGRREALLSQLAAKHVNRVVPARRSLGEGQPRQEDRSRFANVGGSYFRVRERHLAQRVLFQRDLDRLLKGKGRGLRGGLSRGRLPEPQYGNGSQARLEASCQLSSQLWTPAVWIGLIHSVLSSTTS